MAYEPIPKGGRVIYPSQDRILDVAFDNSFGTRLSPMSEVQSVTYVSGPDTGWTEGKWRGMGLTSNHLRDLRSAWTSMSVSVFDHLPLLQKRCVEVRRDLLQEGTSRFARFALHFGQGGKAR